MKDMSTNGERSIPSGWLRFGLSQRSDGLRWISSATFLLIVAVAAPQFYCQDSAAGGQNTADVSSPAETPSVPVMAGGDTSSTTRLSDGTQPRMRRTRRRLRMRGQKVELSDQEQRQLQIRVAPVARQSVRPQLSATGKVLAPLDRRAVVSYLYPARVAEVHFRLGDHVVRGQTLVILESEEIRNALAEYARLLADSKLTRINLDREKRLYDRGVGAYRNLAAAEAESVHSGLNLKAAQKKLVTLGFDRSRIKSLDGAETMDARIELRAPFSGTVVEMQAVPGGMIDQSNDLATIVDLCLLWIHADVYERDISRIKIGQPVRIRVPAYPGREFKGRVGYISELLNEETRTVTVRTEVDNRDQRLKPGMFAGILIQTGSAQRSVVVPEMALLDEEGQKIVFVKEGTAYAPRMVQTGARQGDQREIVNGLEPGEEIVTQGSFLLKSKLYGHLLEGAGAH